MNQSQHTVSIQLGQPVNACLVALPAGNLFNVQYDRVIKPALEQAGFLPLRAHDAYLKPDAIPEAWRSLRSARLLLAELTGRDPSVFYYLGLAHAIGLPVLAIARSEADVPPAMHPARCLYYDVQDPFWGESLKASLTETVARITRETHAAPFLEGISPVQAAAPAVAEPRPRVQAQPPSPRSRFAPAYEDDAAPARTHTPDTESRPRVYGEGARLRSTFPIPEEREPVAPAANLLAPSRPTPNLDSSGPRTRAEDFLPRGRAAYPEAPRFEAQPRPETEAVAVADREAYPRRFPSLAGQRRDAPPQIAGVWQGAFVTEGTEYQGVMKVHQDGDGLSAVMQVTYISREAQVVVEEEFFGTVSGRDLALSGINYAFIQKGKAKEYTLDNFELTLSGDGQRLTGVVKAQDVEGEAAFTHIQEG